MGKKKIENSEKKIDEIEKLKKIGAKKIEEITHIDAKYVEAILNKDIDMLATLNNTKLKGFIKIIEREFNISLDDYQGEFIKTSLEKHPEENINSEGKKEYFLHPKEEEPKNRKYIFLFILIAIFGVAYYFIDIRGEKRVENSSLKMEENLSAIIKDKNVNKITDETITSLEENNIKEEREVENNQTIVSNSNNENNITSSTEENKTEEIEVTTNEESNISTPPKEEKIENLTIESTRGKIWVGIIYLDTHKKSSKMGRKIDIDVDKDQLIVTGHGRFKLYKNDKIETFKGKKIRFLYKDHNLTQISLKEFKEYNRGRGW